MASTGGSSSYSPISMLTGTTLLAPKPVAKPAVAKPTTSTAAKPVTLSSIMSSSGSPSSTAAKKPAAAAVPAGGLDQFMAQRYVAPAQRVDAVNKAWDTSTILPMQTNRITGERRLAPSGMMNTLFDNFMLPARAAAAAPAMLQSAYKAATLPGDVLYGRNQNFNPGGYATAGGIADALNFTGNFAGAGSLASRPANSLGAIAFRTSPNAPLEAMRWAEDYALRNVPPEILLDPMGQRGVMRAIQDKEMNFIAEHSGVRPRFRVDPASGQLVPYNTFAPIPTKTGLVFDSSRVPTMPSGVDPITYSQGWSSLGKVSSVGDYERNIPGISNMNVGYMNPEYVAKYPRTGAQYIGDQNLILLNPNLTNRQLVNVLGHDTSHYGAELAGMPRGTNPIAAGSPINYFRDTGEETARNAGFLAELPASVQKQMRDSEIRDLANYDENLLKPEEYARIGVPPDFVPYTTDARRAEVLAKMDQLLGPAPATPAPKPSLRDTIRSVLRLR